MTSTWNPPPVDAANAIRPAGRGQSPWTERSKMRTTPGHNLRGRLTPTFAASPVEALALGGPMPSPGALPVRPARRTDVARLTELRLWYLAEPARLEPRLRLQAEARERIAQAVSSWGAHQHRGPLLAGRAGAGGGGPQLGGYGTGRA